MNELLDWHWWLIAGFALLILEIFVPGFVLACLGIGALITSPFALLGASLTVQLMAFSVSSIVCFFALRPFVLRTFYKKGEEVKTNADSLVGKEGRVVETINNAIDTGRAIVFGDDWRAESETGDVIEAGQHVVVVKRDSNLITVKPLKSSN